MKRIPRIRSIGYRFVVACEYLREKPSYEERSFALIGRENQSAAELNGDLATT